MDESSIALMEQLQQSPPNMVWIPSGTFRMGSDHYRKEAHPLRYRQRPRRPTGIFKQFVRATRHKTFAALFICETWSGK
jgi:formylglycine-generating enzyme required for sulfatase activity